MKRKKCSMCELEAVVQVQSNARRGLFGWYWADDFCMCPAHAKEWYQRQVIAYNAFFKVKV
jgi:hypothetical protein